MTFKEKRLFSNIIKNYIEKSKKYKKEIYIIFILTSNFYNDEEET